MRTSTQIVRQASLAPGLSAPVQESMLTCPGCGRAGQFALVEQFGSYSLFLCSLCALEFWDPRKRPSAEWYETIYGGRDSRLLPLEPGHRYFLSDPKAPGQGNLLDVGCGTGNFLVAACDAGYTVSGIELDVNAANFAKNQLGLGNVLPLTIEQFGERCPSSKFDLITFFEVLEHQAEPVIFLAAVKACLRPSGWIALSVPNRNRWMTGMDVLDYPPNHFLRWNADSLREFLVPQGFEIVSLREQPAGIPYIAQMFSTALRTGMTRLLAGNEDTSFRDLIQMAPEQAAVAQHPSPSLRRDLVGLLASAKRLACYAAAVIAFPYIRMRRKKGAYLYCLARFTGRDEFHHEPGR